MDIGIYIEEEEIEAEINIEMTSMYLADDHHSIENTMRQEYILVGIYLMILMFLLIFVCCFYQRSSRSRAARQRRQNSESTNYCRQDKPPSYHHLFFSDPLPEYEALSDNEEIVA